MIHLSKEEARRFMLTKQGLYGTHRFFGKSGVRDFVRQAGCVQFDPIDVCGKNAELVFQSRIQGFTKSMLEALLYEDRVLVDYFDKNLAIIDVEDWKYFERTREKHRKHGRGRDEIDAVANEIKSLIAEKGAVCSKDLGMSDKVHWYWSPTNLSRAALETLYFRGDLIVHHKKGTIKYYGLTEDHLPKSITTAEDPLKTDHEHQKWRVLRRISAVGMMWNKASDAWLTIDGFKAQARQQVFESLEREGRIMPCCVAGVKDLLYIVSEDEPLLKEVVQNRMSEHENHKKTSASNRAELIAPLDSLIWDRKLIRELFDFDYKWEIYTPQESRKYGYYVLPVLHGSRFVGRIEVVCDRKRALLVIKNFWPESDIQMTKQLEKEIAVCCQRFAAFHELDGLLDERYT